MVVVVVVVAAAGVVVVVVGGRVLFSMHFQLLSFGFRTSCADRFHPTWMLDVCSSRPEVARGPEPEAELSYPNYLPGVTQGLVCSGPYGCLIAAGLMLPKLPLLYRVY